MRDLGSEPVGTNQEGDREEGDDRHVAGAGRPVEVRVVLKQRDGDPSDRGAPIEPKPPITTTMNA